MNKKETIGMLEGRKKDLMDQIVELDKKEEMKSNTKSNMKSRLTRERNVLSLIIELVGNSEKELSKSSVETLSSLINKGEGGNRVDVKVGDSFVELSIANPKFTWERFLKSCGRAGLKYDNKGKVINA